MTAKSSALVSQTGAGGGNRGDGGYYGGSRGRGTGRGGGHVRTCHHRGQPSHIQRFCWKLHGKPGQQQFANSVANINAIACLSTTSRPWIIDSGASDNMSGMSDTFAHVLRVSRESSRDSTPTVDNSALVSQTIASGGGRGDSSYRGGSRGRGAGHGGGRSAGHGTFQPDNSQGYGQSNASSNGSAAVRTCHHCGQPGHIQRFCWKLRGKPGQQ
ncbi:probable H/ACA ribonucleoprotein complex subunit 1-like protein [Telopea speciosissima]|uniref:probable H/ACA ribonucleoprotein complex subunit 1-like protein n=1 Tax=Telopea speciosissima TaxID=54955 RepID=UPI001CC4465A|nr:probable H/ACA ribonucleoprotein complex subunit 1-like protein [Telopea speciosissima]